MKKIGIVPAAALFENDEPYKDIYRFVNNYTKRVKECGGVPFGILSVDGENVEECLEMADAIIVCGGSRVFPYHIHAIEHAVKMGKPILGICLGMQTINSYFTVVEEMEKRDFKGTAAELFNIMKQEKYMFVSPVAEHWNTPLRDKEEEGKHNVNVAKDTLLHSIVKSDNIRGLSMHRYAINKVASKLTVSARADDGTIEAIEYGDKVLGVQFHPEADDKLNCLFEFLCK